jgi:3-oxoacyl-[acyl-carrier protein] reductase
MFSLHGKVALVTGAGAVEGIGFASAKALKDCGAELWICATSDRIYERAQEIGAHGFVGDLSEQGVVQELQEKIPNLDILVNNAGMTSISSPAGSGEATTLDQVSLDDWHKSMARNVDTAFLVTRAFLPALRKSNSGRIIMMSSVTGSVMVMREQPVYATAKAALIGLTKSLALDEAKYGITCNAILPGWIATDAISEVEKRNGLSVPLGRGGTPEEIAAVVAFLASPEASYLTGQALVVDGGNSIMEERV